MIIEYCTESVQDAIDASVNGANRIELCAELSLGGLTPDIETVRSLLLEIRIPIRVILRPTDSFYLTKKDFEEIEKSVQIFSPLDIEGFVFGYLNTNNSIDLRATENIINLAPNRRWTFHKAIDQTPDILEAIKSLEYIPQIDTILSSGGASTAIDGLQTLQKMQKISTKTIMPGGSITWQNIEVFNSAGHFNALHGRKIIKISNNA